MGIDAPAVDRRIAARSSPRARRAAFDLASLVDGILSRRPAVGLAVAILQNSRLEGFESRGFADLSTRKPVTEDTVFRIGSITKTFTALAVLQLWERGLVDLDAPVDHYLRSYRIVASPHGFRAPTLRHLLTHTSGIPDVRRFVDLLDFRAGPWDARVPVASAPFGQRLPSLASYYATGLEAVAEPGSVFAYSSHGFATLGQIVEDVARMPLARYLRDRVFQPLGMASTDLVRTAPIAARLARGYAFVATGPQLVEDREWLGSGAGGAYSTARDLGRYAAALVGGGANEHGSVVRPATLMAMFERQYETDRALPAMGLSFFVSDIDGHHVVGHDGILPGFNAHLSVAPQSGTGLVVLTNGSSGAMRWIPDETDRLMRRLLGVERRGAAPSVPHHPEIWSEIVGRYALPPRASDLRGRLAMGGGLEVFIGAGRPMLRLRVPVPALWRGLPLQPDDADDPRAFGVDLAPLGMGRVRLRFRWDRVRRRRVIHTDLGGQPITFDSITPAPHRRSRALLAAVGLAGTVALARRAGGMARPRHRRPITDSRPTR